MQLLTKLFQVISQVAPVPGLSEKEAKLLSALNPEKFYIENVRSIMDISYANAFQICETAVRQGLFLRGVEVKCPDGAVAASANSEAELPEIVRCWHLEGGHYEAEELPTRDLQKSTFYRLNANSEPYRKSA
jgi:hypothetical protein